MKSNTRIISYDHTVELHDDDLDVMLQAIAAALRTFGDRFPNRDSVGGFEKARYEALHARLVELL